MFPCVASSRWFVALFCCLVITTVCGYPQTTIRSGVLSLGIPRPKDESVWDVTEGRNKLVGRRDKYRLRNRIAKVPEDVQIVIADNIDTTLSSKEFATELFNSWPMGDSKKGYHGVLILILGELNRIEIEFGDGLKHVMDTEWCQEILYTKVVPFFRLNQYYSGFANLVDSVSDVLARKFGSVERAQKNHLRRVGAFLGLATLARYRENIWGRVKSLWERDGPDPPGADDSYHRRPRPKPSLKPQPRHAYMPTSDFFMNLRHNSLPKSGYPPRPQKVHVYHHSIPESKTDVRQSNTQDTHPLEVDAESKEEQSATNESTSSSESSIPKTVKAGIKIVNRLSDSLLSQQEDTSNKSAAKQAPTKPRASGQGAGASWTSPAERSQRMAMSSGYGSGASWSSVQERPSSQQDNKSSGNGAGAGW